MGPPTGHGPGIGLGCVWEGLLEEAEQKGRAVCALSVDGRGWGLSSVVEFA